MRTAYAGLKLAMAVGVVVAASTCGGGAPSVVTIAVDLASEPRRISPLIYGVSASGGGSPELGDMGITVVGRQTTLTVEDGLARGDLDGNGKEEVFSVCA